MSNHAILLAAGSGQRFGSTKQFYPFRGRPLFLYALESFEQNKHINDIVLVVPRQKTEYTKKILKALKLRKVHDIVTGGRRRQDSVLRGLESIHGSSGIIVIHDGVRPIVSQRLINKGIRLCSRNKAVIFGTRASDTIKFVKNNLAKKTVPRDNLYFIQTPQFFELNLLRNAYEKADLSFEYTDDAAILESLNIPVHIYQGDRLNIKITSRGDLNILDHML